MPFAPLRYPFPSLVTRHPLAPKGAKAPPNPSGPRRKRNKPFLIKELRTLPITYGLYPFTSSDLPEAQMIRRQSFPLFMHRWVREHAGTPATPFISGVYFIISGYRGGGGVPPLCGSQLGCSFFPLQHRSSLTSMESILTYLPQNTRLQVLLESVFTKNMGVGRCRL